ncbi:MAG: hypothetical protein DRG30_06165 [Epsilonproteobacteria bacterium]|nr:MAG: hypothetical protein DRG30_06165 [Campylobacterota bacterium]
MALVIYPDVGYDSFVTLIEAEEYISSLTLYGSMWGAISDDEKEIYLRIALRVILDGIDLDTYPLSDPIDTCAGEAQSLIAINDLVNEISITAEDTSGAIRRNKVGSIEQEFFAPKFGKKSKAIIPKMAKSCLESINYNTTSLYGLSQSILGRS